MKWQTRIRRRSKNALPALTRPAALCTHVFCAMRAHQISSTALPLPPPTTTHTVHRQPPTTTIMSTSAPAPVRKYPYQIIGDVFYVKPAHLDAVGLESEWENAPVADMVKEYMRRGCAEGGDTGAARPDPSKPLQLALDMSDYSLDHAQSAFERWRVSGFAAKLIRRPTVMQEIREMCDQICSLAARLKEDDGSSVLTDTTHGKVMDRLTEIYRSMQDALSEEEEEDVTEEDTTKE